MHEAPPRYWPAVGWTFLAGLIGALCAILPLMITLPFAAVLGVQTALVTQSVGSPFWAPSCWCR